MRERINSASLFFRQFLVVDDDGVKHCAPGMFQTATQFRFDEIVCVLLAPDNTLSFQVGDQVYSIATKPNDKKHQAAIAALIQSVEATVPSPVVSAVPP